MPLSALMAGYCSRTMGMTAALQLDGAVRNLFGYAPSSWLVMKSAGGVGPQT